MNNYTHLLGNGQIASIAGTVNSALAKSSTPIKLLYSVGSLAGTMMGVYHGYKRNNRSVGWAFWWGIMGGLFWPFAIPLAVGQGFGRSKDTVVGLAGFRELQKKFKQMRRRR